MLFISSLLKIVPVSNEMGLHTEAPTRIVPMTTRVSAI